MFDKILKSAGSLATYFRKYSDEHKKFLSSGMICSKCGTRLVLTTSLNYYSADGKQIPVWKGLGYREYFAEFIECTTCYHRWKILDTSKQISQEELEVLAKILETDRLEENIGVDHRVIDNSMSSTKLTRRFSVSKEWAKSYTVEYEKVQVAGIDFNIGISEAVSVKAVSEETIKRKYFLSNETKEICSEEVEIEVPAFTKLSVIFKWKRIIQRGFILVRNQNNIEVKIPFQVIVGVTFDQRHVDEKTNI